jgi:hypothetical protein
MARVVSWRPTIQRRGPKPPQPPPPTKRWWTRPKQLVAAGAAFLGAMAAMATFLPRVSVTPLSQVVPENEAPSIFAVQNAGLVPLEDVQPMLIPCQISLNTHPVPEDRESGCTYNSDITPRMGGFVPTLWHQSFLGIDHRYTISMQEVFKTTNNIHIGYADFALIVTYKPWFLPWRRQASFRFTTEMQGDGLLYWKERDPCVSCGHD